MQVPSMKRTRIFLLCIPCVLFGQPSGSSLLTGSGPGPTGPIGPPPAKTVPSELTIQQSKVAPSDLPDRFEFGRQSALTNVHETQITDLLARMRSVESSISWGRGGIAAIVFVFAALVMFLKAFWKPILRMLLHEASPPRIASPPLP